jgi:protein TonB
VKLSSTILALAIVFQHPTAAAQAAESKGIVVHTTSLAQPNPNLPEGTSTPVMNIACERPVWTEHSVPAGSKAVVTLRILVGAEGAVKDMKIARSSGYRGLDRAVVDAIGKCRFKPGLVGGKPEEQWTSLQYVWEES